MKKSDVIYKRLFKAVIVAMFSVLLILLFIFPVYGDDESKESVQDEIYDSEYQLSGADTLINELPKDVRQNLEKLGITSPNWKQLNSLSFFDVVGNILDNVEKQSITPINCMVKILGVLMLVSLVNSVKSSIASSALTGVLDSVAVLSVSIILIIPLCETIEYSATVIRLSADFMFAFVPIMTAIIIAMGQSLQGVGNYTTVMTAGTVVSMISKNILVPLLNTFLGISVVSGISNKVNLKGFCELINKVIKWVLTFTMSIFTAVLTMQSIVTASVDSAGTKATRFAISSFVPLVGGALSEAYQTVRGCMGMLKSGVGVFSILATATIYVPAIISCVLWLVSINISVAMADVFDMGKLSTLLKSITTVLNVTIAVLLCCMMIFIISSAVMLMAGGIS